MAQKSDVSQLLQYHYKKQPLELAKEAFQAKMDYKNQNCFSVG